MHLRKLPGHTWLKRLAHHTLAAVYVWYSERKFSNCEKWSDSYIGNILHIRYRYTPALSYLAAASSNVKATSKATSKKSGYYNSKLHRCLHAFYVHSPKARRYVTGLSMHASCMYAVSLTSMRLRLDVGNINSIYDNYSATMKTSTSCEDVMQHNSARMTA